MLWMLAVVLLSDCPRYSNRVYTCTLNESITSVPDDIQSLKLKYCNEWNDLFVSSSTQIEQMLYRLLRSNSISMIGRLAFNKVTSMNILCVRSPLPSLIWYVNMCMYCRGLNNNNITFVADDAFDGLTQLRNL